MKRITTSKGNHALVDNDDYEKLKHYKWSDLEGYAARRVGNTTIRMHRVIMDAPPGLEVDHINGNRSDNRKKNLRICTRAENARNTNCTGVSYHKRDRRWQAEIMLDGVKIYLGIYKTKRAALKVRRAAEKKYFGEFAYKRKAA